MAGNTLIPAASIATTKGDADAPPAVPLDAAAARRGDDESTIMPTMSIPNCGFGNEGHGFSGLCLPLKVVVRPGGGG
jgi:hypothetical protein